jgi:phosphosulfolactate synthase (CoM biosynthesis protein A)
MFVYDNEPRNKDIVRQMNKVVRAGHKIVIWPARVVEKDINDMVLSSFDVESILQNSMYQGLEAELRMSSWRRI